MIPIAITTAHHRFIIYTTSAGDLTWINQPILKQTILWQKWDLLIRQSQKWLIPKRILKYEYIHLLEILSSEKNFYHHLNYLITEKHSRTFRYDLCSFIHKLQQGQAMPAAFSESFDHISEYVLLLKNPNIAKELKKLIPFIIHGIDQQIGSRVKLTGITMMGITVITFFCTSAFFLANSTFKRLAYHHEFHYLKMHPIAQTFQDTFTHLTPDLIIQYLSQFGLFFLLITIGNRWQAFRKITDPFILKLPFYGKLIQFRTAQRILYTLRLAKSCHLDFDHTMNLIEEQIQHPTQLQTWRNMKNDTLYQFELDHALNQFLEPLAIKLSSLSEENINMTFNLIHQEVQRRQRNTELALLMFFGTIITTLLLWLLLTWAALERILLIFQ